MCTFLIGAEAAAASGRHRRTAARPRRGRGKSLVIRAQFELFELILLSKLDKPFPVERFEATVSQSAVPFLLHIEITL